MWGIQRRFQGTTSLSASVLWKSWNMSAITCHIQDKKRMRTRQVGFVKGKSSLSKLLPQSDFYCLVAKGKSMVVVYLDFSKAFATVFHSILLEKLAAHGSDRCTLCWVKSWLHGRSRVVVNGGGLVGCHTW